MTMKDAGLWYASMQATSEESPAEKKRQRELIQSLMSNFRGEIKHPKVCTLSMIQASKDRSPRGVYERFHKKRREHEPEQGDERAKRETDSTVGHHANEERSRRAF